MKSRLHVCLRQTNASRSLRQFAFPEKERQYRNAGKGEMYAAAKSVGLFCLSSVLGNDGAPDVW